MTGWGGYWTGKRWRFNCAAPERERLFCRRGITGLTCRSFNCALAASLLHLPTTRYNRIDLQELQLCRSLSGAVISVGGSSRNSSKVASIVPLPFGSGYDSNARESDGIL